MGFAINVKGHLDTQFTAISVFRALTRRPNTNLVFQIQAQFWSIRNSKTIVTIQFCTLFGNLLDPWKVPWSAMQFHTLPLMNFETDKIYVSIFGSRIRAHSHQQPTKWQYTCFHHERHRERAWVRVALCGTSSMAAALVLALISDKRDWKERIRRSVLLVHVCLEAHPRKVTTVF